MLSAERGSSLLRDDLGQLYQQLKELDRSDERLTEQICLMGRYEHFIQNGGTFPEASSENVSLESIEAHCETLFSYRELNSTQRKTLLEDINICSRPRLRSLTVLDLPDEILLRVCEYVRGWQPDVLRFGSTFLNTSNDIKSLRLTCWRFCNTSSHLFLPFVRVELNQASLERLNAISQHPMISKGVRVVRVVLDYYDYDLANDLAFFAEFSAVRMGECANSLELGLSLGTKDLAQNNMITEKLRKARLLETSWLSFVNDGIDHATSETNPSYQDLLHIAHEEYRSRATDQKQVCENGYFIHSVATAFARMPRARRVEIQQHDDEGIFRKRAAPIRAGEDACFVSWILQPMNWDTGRQWGLRTPHIDALALPGAMCEAGVLPQSLDIKITSLPESNDILNQKELRRLSMGAQQLKDIKIMLQRHRTANDPEFRLNPETAELNQLRDYIDAVLNTDSIERLSLDFECFLNEDTDLLIDLGSLMTFKLWGNLVEVSWSSVSLHQKEIECFFEQRRKPLESLRFSTVHLLTGSWADTLEVLRTAPTGYQVSLGGLSGAECTDLSDEENKRIFHKQSDDYWGTSRAEDFVTGASETNPLTADETDQHDA
ncbi:MAG: hypothetical protein Q9204_000072 [Flavoplaca sp. TL-2023a]